MAEQLQFTQADYAQTAHGADKYVRGLERPKALRSLRSMLTENMYLSRFFEERFRDESRGSYWYKAETTLSFFDRWQSNTAVNYEAKDTHRSRIAAKVVRSLTLEKALQYAAYSESYYAEQYALTDPVNGDAALYEEKANVWAGRKRNIQNAIHVRSQKQALV